MIPIPYKKIRIQLRLQYAYLAYTKTPLLIYSTIANNLFFQKYYSLKKNIKYYYHFYLSYLFFLLYKKTRRREIRMFFRTFKRQRIY